MWILEWLWKNIKYRAFSTRKNDPLFTFKMSFIILKKVRHTKIYRTSKNSLKIKKINKQTNHKKAAVVFLPGVRSNHLIPLSTKICVSFYFRSLLKVYLRATSTFSTSTNFKWINYSKQEQKNPITSEDGIINSQLRFDEACSTRYMQYKKKPIKLILGTISTYSTTNLTKLINTKKQRY